MTAMLTEPAPADQAEPRPKPACRGADLAEFFGSPGEHARRVRTRLTRSARVYCAVCPLLIACGEHADRNGDEGLWGGVWRYRPGGRGHIVRIPLTSGATR